MSLQKLLLSTLALNFLLESPVLTQLRALCFVGFFVCAECLEVEQRADLHDLFEQLRLHKSRFHNRRPLRFLLLALFSLRPGRGFCLHLRSELLQLVLIDLLAKHVDLVLDILAAGRLALLLLLNLLSHCAYLLLNMLFFSLLGVLVFTRKHYLILN